MPKKPKSLRKLHDYLSKALIPHTKKGIPLNQELEFLDGMVVEGFTIEVPKMSNDLIETSIELEHCVHTYKDRVRNGFCNVINLKKEGRRVYTLKIEKEEDGLHLVSQFKGHQNEDSMEGPSGERIRGEILLLIQNSDMISQEIERHPSQEKYLNGK